MKTLKTAALLTVGLILASCGSKHDEQEAEPVPQGNFTVSSPIKFSDNPAIRQEQQQGMVDSMLADPGIPLDAIEGEAARRGVTLTDEQRAAKRAQQAAAPTATGSEEPAT